MAKVSNLLSEELMQRVQKIEIAMSKRVDLMLSGGYRSRYKGTGVQFAEHRPYVPGDDVRHLDWKVSARTREPLIKQFEEERERQVFLVVDLSLSTVFGSTIKSKREAIAEMTALLAMAAQRVGDKVGLLVFAHQKQSMLKPKRGRQQVLRVIREVLAFEADSGPTRLAHALEATDRVLKNAGVVLIMSDFMAKQFEIPLRRLQRRHDVLACWIHDPLERALVLPGLWKLVDPETQYTRWSVPNRKNERAQWEKLWQSHVTQTRNVLRKARVDCVEVKTQEAYVDRLVTFFNRRKLTRR